MLDYSDDAKQFLHEYKKSTAIQDHQDIIKQFGEEYERAYQQINTFWAEAYRDQSFYLGYQWSLEELSYLNNQRRSAFTYNMIRRMISLIEGIQRSNRMSTIFTPIEDASSDTADLLSDVNAYVMQNGGGYEILSTAFKDACTTGIAWISPYLDYRDDPVSGDIKFHLDNWNAVIFDPFFTQRDLSDCGFIARRKFLSRTEVISLLPDKEDVISNLSYGSRDDKFSYQPYARQWGMQKLLNYTEYWKPKWVMKDVLVDMRSGECVEWKGPRERLKIITNIDPALQVIRKPVRTVELGIIVEGELLYYGENPYGLNNYPFVPVWACYEPSFDLWTWKLQSLVRFIRDPQVELNKRRSKMVDIIDAQLNSGWIAKTGAVTNNSSLFKTGNGQVVFVKPEANIDTDLRRIEAPTIPDSQFALMDAFEKDIPNILGINPEMMGMPENEKVETAAILSKMRQAAGLVSLRNVFDSLSESQKILGKITMELIQKNYTPEKVALITKKQVTPEFYSGSFARYDVVVEQGTETDTQKQEQFSQLLALKQMGFNIPDSLIIKSSGLVRKRELNEILDAQAQQEQEMIQKREELEQHQIKVMTDGIESKAASDQALAQERLNKIQLDAALSAERIARSEEDRTAGVLNLIKAIKELEGMDINQMAQKVQMLTALEAGQLQKEEATSPVG